ncbi:hypothetical protein ABFS82_14G123000 [Erythranthe guttata]
MIALESSISYTSLKDLMPPSTSSPTGSWREIPIKDPLLQHAAWAYLRPVAADRGDDGRWWRRFAEKFCGLFVCLNGVVLMVFEGVFSGHVMIKV